MNVENQRIPMICILHCIFNMHGKIDGLCVLLSPSSWTSNSQLSTFYSQQVSKKKLNEGKIDMQRTTLTSVCVCLCVWMCVFMDVCMLYYTNRRSFKALYSSRSMRNEIYYAHKTHVRMVLWLPFFSLSIPALQLFLYFSSSFYRT